MAWSTRQVAELAGTTVKAVRHYHKLGLLAEPDRRSNGYKLYGVDHLRRLVRIRRLTELGVPLSEIAELGEADEHPAERLRRLDDELAADIDRLQSLRAELDVILKQQVPTDLPPELGPASEHLTEADRALMVVISRVVGPAGTEPFRQMLVESRRESMSTEFDELAADADEETRAALAERLVPQVIGLYARHPGLARAQSEAPGGIAHATRTIQLAIEDLYNPAQRDVLGRVRRLLDERRTRDAQDRVAQDQDRQEQSPASPGTASSGVRTDER